MKPHGRYLNKQTVNTIEGGQGSVGYPTESGGTSRNYLDIEYAYQGLNLRGTIVIHIAFDQNYAALTIVETPN